MIEQVRCMHQYVYALIAAKRYQVLQGRMNYYYLMGIARQNTRYRLACVAGGFRG